MRLLALVFGVTIHAVGTVLAAFMFGLAIGSAWAGRLSDVVRRPLFAFAAAEALVAVARSRHRSGSTQSKRSIWD